MSSTSKKSGGLIANPLLSRTEVPPPTTAATVLPQSSDTGMPVDTQARGRADASTSKFTFYFTEEQLDRLDLVWERMRREGRRSGQRVTKSHVVRVALDRLLDDFDRTPEAVVNELKQQLNR